MDSLEILDTFFHLHTKYRHKSAMGEEPIFLVEQENIAKSLGPVLYKKMEDEDQWITIEKMPPILDKMLRARSLQSRIRGHRVEFDHEAPWWPTLKHEMMTFPLSTYTDQVDAMAWVGHYISSMQEPPGWDEIEDDEWDDFEEDAGFYFGTANRVTGY
jgi:predicted phage terminase large subunit-like protein